MKLLRLIVARPETTMYDVVTEDKDCSAILKPLADFYREALWIKPYNFKNGMTIIDFLKKRKRELNLTASEAKERGLIVDALKKISRNFIKVAGDLQ